MDLQHLMTEQHTDLLGLKTGYVSNKPGNLQLLLSAAAIFDCKPRASEVPPGFRGLQRGLMMRKPSGNFNKKSLWRFNGKSQ